ncbi:uncharacterized protein LOC127527414 [Erpetoichthys calabaricus]|uniref:uncharacterized protein LOC127527414 n=1 Tax=Erpetoichthys calabaricus TaxID=27687 RepID=UPI0022347CD4|nr:uncharacterized protein LOC127527414 [Erpetoichthys calabaricus]
MDIVVPVRTVRCYANNKPWITSDIKGLLNQKKRAFKSGDQHELKRMQKELQVQLRVAKEQYKRKLEQKLQNNSKKETMADSEMNRVAIVVEELQALDKQIQKLLSRQRYLRDLKARLLNKPSLPSEIDITSTPRCAAHFQGQVSFTPAPRRSDDDTDEDLGVFQLCRRGFKARTPPSAQVNILTQNRFDSLRVPSLPSTPGDVIVVGDSIVRNLKVACPNRKSFVSCFSGARVRDIMRCAPTIYEKHKNRAVESIVLHAGVNDIRHRQSEILKADFAALIKDTKERTPSARIFISGPLPLFR